MSKLSVFKVAPFRNDYTELSIRFDVTGHRFIRDFFEDKGMYCGGDSNNIFHTLDVNNTNYILVTCHGSRKLRGSFMDNDINSNFLWTAQAFFDKLKAKCGQSSPTLTVVFAQCYGGLMATDLLQLMAQDSSPNCWSNVKVVGLSTGTTRKSVIPEKVQGLQTLHYDLLFFVLSKVHHSYSLDDLLGLIGRKDFNDPDKNPSPEHILVFETYVKFLKLPITEVESDSDSE